MTPTINDELPQPPIPQADGSTESAVANFDATFDPSILADVPKMNDPIPAGTYEFRLDKFTKKLDKDNMPRYDVQWKCQQEPHTGRVAFDFVSWISGEDLAAASNTSNPRCQEARDLIRKRLPRVKAIMEAAGYKAVGPTNLDEFFSTQPVVKIQLTVAERKGKDKDGKYTIPSGDMQNNIQNYISLSRPA